MQPFSGRWFNLMFVSFLLLVLFISNLYPQNTIFTSQVPSHSGTDGDYELGTKFTTSQFSEITAIRFYKMAGETGTHNGNIWLSDGTIIASVQFSDESTAGWQTAVLSPAVFISPGTVYIVSVNVNTIYPIEQNGLSSAITNGILSTVSDGYNGVFNEIPGQFPAQTFNKSNYFVDVIAAPLNEIFTNQIPTGEFNDGPYELGVKFTSSQTAKVKYIKYYKTSGESDSHIGNLWSANGTKLASAVFTNETASGWQYAPLNTTVYLSASTTYVVSVNSNITYAASDAQALANTVTNGILSTIADSKNGVYSGIPNTKGVFPTESFNNVNYFRDIVVEPIYTPTVPVLISPVNNAAGISIESTLTWGAISGATSYMLQVAKDSAFNNSILNVSDIKSTSYSLKGLSNDQQYFWRIKAVNDVTSSSFSAPAKFTTVKYRGVELSWPTGGTALYVKEPVISWYVPQGGTGWKYDLFYSTNQNMTSSTVISNLTLNQYTLTNLQPGTDYYWQVRLKTATGVIVSYSTIEKFVSFGKALVPVASWPIGNPTVYTLSPILYWFLNDASTDLTYELEIREGSSTALTGTPTIPNIAGSSVNVANLLSGKQYSWRVRSKSGSNYSAWSAAATFTTVTVNAVTVPFPSWPVGYPTVYSTSPTLNWYLGTSAMGLTYQVEYVEGLNTTFSGVPNIMNINSLSTQLSGLTPGKDYKWRVRSTDGITNSDWSSAESFKIYTPANAGPIVPVPSWPTGGAYVYSSSTQLNWYLGATVTGLTFEVEYGTGTLNGTPTITGINTLNTPVSNLQSGVTYKWRVRSKSGNSYSSWSATETFKTVSNAVVSTTPVLSWPIGGATVYTNSPLLSWFLNSGSNGLTYELQYSTSSNMSNPVTISALTAKQYTVQNLNPGATYYWRVRSFDGTVYSSYSAIANFVTFAGNSAVTPVAGSPVSGVTVTESSPVLSWFIPTMGDVQGYEVQYSGNPDMSLAQTSSVSANTIKINVTNGNSYFWRVRSRNSKGEFSEYSEVANFSKLSVTGLVDISKTVTSYDLAQNYPNPFNPVTTIVYEIPGQTHVVLTIFDMLGREVATLVNKDQSAGRYNVKFDGASLPGGVYIYTIHAGQFSDSKKLVLLK